MRSRKSGLFPHYTVGKTWLWFRSWSSGSVKTLTSAVEEVLGLVGLPGAEFADRYPHQLSGGQRQRVGLARSLAADPPILLMDEPFGALDPITRAELQMEFKKLQQRLGKTIVFVTHDVGEALLLGTRIGLMESGSLRGIYTPDEFLHAADSCGEGLRGCVPGRPADVSELRDSSFAAVVRHLTRKREQPSLLPLLRSISP